MTNLYGATVISDDDVRAIISLLTTTMKGKTSYIHFTWVNELTPEEDYDFVIVANLEHISMLRKHYAVHHVPVPPIIHFIRSGQLDEIDYAADFPELTIYPIEYSPLDESDKTLQYDSFYYTLALLDESKTKANETAP